MQMLCHDQKTLLITQNDQKRRLTTLLLRQTTLYLFTNTNETNEKNNNAYHVADRIICDSRQGANDLSDTGYGNGSCTTHSCYDEVFRFGRLLAWPELQLY